MWLSRVPSSAQNPHLCALRIDSLTQYRRTASARRANCPLASLHRCRLSDVCSTSSGLGSAPSFVANVNRDACSVERAKSNRLVWATAIVKEPSHIGAHKAPCEETSSPLLSARGREHDGCALLPTIDSVASAPRALTAESHPFVSLRRRGIHTSSTVPFPDIEAPSSPTRRVYRSIIRGITPCIGGQGSWPTPAISYRFVYRKRAA